MRSPAAVSLRALWEFTRPHTIIGTVAAVCALYVLATHAAQRQDIALWALVLAASLAVNIYVVGLNQITDVEIDRINKPYLPIAAGDLSMTQAWWIVGVCGLVPVLLALTQGTVELVGVLAEIGRAHV